VKVEAVRFKEQNALQFSKAEDSVDFEAILEGISENMFNVCQLDKNNQDKIKDGDNIGLDVLQANLNNFMLNLYKQLDSNLLNFNLKDLELEKTALNQLQNLNTSFVETNDYTIKEAVSEKQLQNMVLNELINLIQENEKISIDFGKIENLLSFQESNVYFNKDVNITEEKSLLELSSNKKLFDINQNVNDNLKNINQDVTKLSSKNKFVQNDVVAVSKDDMNQIKSDLLQSIDDVKFSNFKEISNKETTIKEDYGFIEHTANNNVLKDVKDLKAEIVKVIPYSKAEEIVDIAIQKFKSIRLPDLTELRVKLKPEDLGEITIKVVLEKGEIKGNIIAEKKEVALLLQNNVENIKQELRNNNLNVSNITVYLSNDGLGSSSNREFSQFSRNNRHKNVELEFDEKIKESEEGLNIYA